jgi:thioredoxin 1
MAMAHEYSRTEPTRAELDRSHGTLLVEFGAPSCGICRAAQPAIEAALSDYPKLPHIKVADGSGRPLGRSFHVQLWPTLIALRDGKEVARLVRPTSRQAISELLATLRAILILTTLLSAAGALSACSELKGTEPAARCTKAYDKCVLPSGVLGICDPVECTGDSPPPCLVCRSQH